MHSMRLLTDLSQSHRSLRAIEAVLRGSEAYGNGRHKPLNGALLGVPSEVKVGMLSPGILARIQALGPLTKPPLFLATYALRPAPKPSPRR